MSKAKEFQMIQEISNTDKVVILTDNYQIVGKVYDCDKCNKDEYVNLTNVSVCLIKEVYETKSCDNYTSSHYDWLHVNFDKIIAFSFVM